MAPHLVCRGKIKRGNVCRGAIACLHSESCGLYSVLLPFFKVVGMDRREEDWYASDNNLRGTPRGSRKKPNAGR